MSENHRYYWLKLQETFFEDDTIDFIESQENGERYVLFYLKLCLKALKNEGKLIRYVGELLMPYDEVGIAKLTKTDVDTVRSALILFSKIGLIKRLDSGEIYLTQLNELIGTETSAAQRKRKQRINEKARLSLECDNVTDMSQEGHTDIEIDKELELKNTDKDISSDEPKEETMPFPELKDLENETKTKKTSSRIRKTNNTFSKSDYNECMDIYYKNRVQLGKTHPVENTIYKIQSFQGIIKPYFEDYGVEVVKQAIKNSFYNSWAASTSYGLTVIFNRKKFDEYVSGSKGTVHTQQYKNNKQRGSFASEVYGKEQNWEIE